jgi:hypothetical protein
MGVEVLVPLGLFAMIVAVVALPAYFKTRERTRLHDTLRVAYERGQPVDPALIEMIQRGEKARPTAERDLRVGVVLIAIALAMITLGSVIGYHEDEDAFSIMSGVAAFPGFIGLAFLAFWAAKRGKQIDRIES